MKQRTRKHQRWLAGVAALSLATIGSAGARAEAQMPSIDVQDEPWQVDVFYENDTRRRGKDATGRTVGLSKFRNTLQVEADKKLSDGWSFRGIFRGSHDGVYRLNKNQFGDDAGSRSAAEARLHNTAGPFAAGLPGVHQGTTVPFGGGIGYTVVDAVQAGAGLPDLGGPGGGPGINQFVDPNYADLNTPPAQYGSGAGLRVLGDAWHNPNHGGIAFAVPVRPCDADKRGCADFGGYGKQKQRELESPEFNDRWDFLREVYVRKTFNLSDGSDFFVKLGKQQVVWGRTDLFRVLDVINPVDYSRNNIYDELQDIRIPMWIAQGEWRMGPSESMQERNLSVVWNFDQFRANNLGQCGSPNVMLDAGCFFRGMKNLWDNGGTVANFASFVPPGTPGDLSGAWLATNFGAHQIGIRNVELPDWRLSNTQLGVKFEGVTQDGLSFSLNALHYRSQLPSLRAINTAAVNPFTGASGNSSPFSGPAQGASSAHLIAFDMHFPRVNLIGGSMDFQSETLGAAFRLEGALTFGEEFVNTARPRLYSRNRVLRTVVGVDRPTFIPFISTSTATLISAQLFYQHIFDHEEYSSLAGKVGMPDWEHNVMGTLLIKGNLHNGRVSPQILMARDFQARAWVASPSVEWSLSDDLKITFGANVKGKSDSASRRWQSDDCRSCNPYAPYTNYAGQGFDSGSAGLSGLEPLGRFRAGPIGAAWKEDEIFFTMRYKF